MDVPVVPILANFDSIAITYFLKKAENANTYTCGFDTKMFLD